MNQIRPTPHSIGWLKWLAVAALIVVVPLVALWLIPNSRTSAKIQTKINAIKLAGYPVTAGDLQKMYPPLPDDQNSVIIYQKAFLNYVKLPDNTTNWPIVSGSEFPFRSQALPAEVKRDIANFINQNKATLELLHQAAGIEKGWYDLGLSNGLPVTGDPPVVEIGESAQLLAVAAVLRAVDQQSSQAAQLIMDSLGLARSLNNSPTSISQTMRDQVIGLSCSTTELALNQTAFPEDELRHLSTAFAEAEKSVGLKQSLAFERCTMFWLHDMVTSNAFSRPNESLKGKLIDIYTRLTSYPERDFLSQLDITDQYIAISEMPYPKRLQFARQLHDKTVHSSQNNNMYGSFMADWEIPFEIEAKTQAELALCQTALAIQSYRLANHNQIPATLQDLVPVFLSAVPPDPFDGQPLRYRKLPKGYLIYSIGGDGKDDGGKEWDQAKQTGDITFTIER